MGLDILPKGGISFRSRSGSGNFKRKLNKLTYNPGGEFGMLKNNQEAIVAAIDKRAGAIRSYGGLTRLQRKSVLHEIIDKDKTVTKQDKYKIKEILDKYARDKKSAPVSEVPPAAPPKVPTRLRINRDPSFNREASGAGYPEQTGLASVSSASVNPNAVSPARTGLASNSSPSAAHYSSSANRGEVMSAGLTSGRVERPDRADRLNSGSVSRGQNNFNSKPGGLKPGSAGNASFKNNLLRSLK